MNLNFTQLDINLKRYKYIVEDTGIRVISRSLYSTTERFFLYEDIGSEIIKVKKRELIWLIPSVLFFILAVTVFIRRIIGSKVADTAEIFWLSVSAVLFIIYAFKRKNSVFLANDNEASGIEFIGTKIYENRLNQFIKQLLQRRDEYLSNKYPEFNGLTAAENILCVNSGIQPVDGLFLKTLTRCPVKKLNFESMFPDVVKPGGICSVTTEVNARRIIDKYQEQFISKGMYIFISEFSENEYYVGMVGTTSDPYKIMEYAETNGANYNIETKDIINKYKQWQKQFGIKPIAIGFDFCECEIINKDIDYKKLSAEVYEFCPDVVDQGTGTIELLESEMKSSGTIFLWWD